MNYLAILLAFLCAIFAEVIALGNKLGNSTIEQWLIGVVIFYLLSLLVPWVESRRGV